MGGQTDAMDPMPSTATAKRTRTLRKKQNRFLADSESESESDHEAHEIMNELDNFNYQRINNTADANRVTANIIASTPMLQRVLSRKDREAKEREKERVSPLKVQMPVIAPQHEADDDNAEADDDDELDITDIQKAIRAQPRRRRRKSMANLQHLLAQEHEHEDNEDGDGDSEATESEEDEAPSAAPPQCEPRRQIEQQPVEPHRAMGNMSFGVDPMRSVRSPSEPLQSREPSMPNPYLDSALMNGLSTFSPPQNASFVGAHQIGQNSATNQNTATNEANPNPNESVDWNVNFNTSVNSGGVSDKDRESNLGLHLSILSPTQPGKAQQPRAAAEEPNMFESLLRANYAEDAQTHAAAPKQGREEEDEDDEETDDEATESDAEMFDAVHAAINAPFDDPIPDPEPAYAAPKAPEQELTSAMQIFSDAERMEKDASILQASEHSSPAPEICAEKKQTLRKNYKRYRRKSFVPQMDAFDDLDHLNDAEEEEEEEEEAVQQSVPQHIAAEEEGKEEGRLMVCEMHRNKAKGVASFEYECVKCECFLSADEKIRYQELLRKANDAEKHEDWGTAMEALMNALEICNSEQSLHTRCMEMGRLLFQ